MLGGGNLKAIFLQTTKRLLKPLFYRLPRIQRVYLAASRYVALCEGYYNWYELNFDGEYEFLRRYLQCKRSPVIFDVGANIGQWSNLVRTICPNATLHLFEPAPSAFERLVSRFPPNSAIINKCAVSNSPGNAPLLLFDNGLENSLLPCWNKTPRAVIQTPVITLDQYCLEKHIDHIDLLKIDVEGNEVKVMQGARSLLDSTRIECLQFEYSWKWIGSRAYLKDVFDMLSNTYSLYKILPHGLWEISQYHPYFDNFRCSNWVAIQKDSVTRLCLGSYITKWATLGYGV